LRSRHCWVGGLAQMDGRNEFLANSSIRRLPKTLEFWDPADLKLSDMEYFKRSDSLGSGLVQSTGLGEQLLYRALPVSLVRLEMS
jgi:hypothetical protein